MAQDPKLVIHRGNLQDVRKQIEQSLSYLDGKISGVVGGPSTDPGNVIIAGSDGASYWNGDYNSLINKPAGASLWEVVTGGIRYSSGLVGIGLQEPLSDLDIGSGVPVYNSNFARLRIRDDGGTAGIFFDQGLKENYTLIVACDEGGTPRNILNYSNDPQNLTILANRGANSRVELRANSASAGGAGENTILVADGATQNVGIGTSTPAASLHVEGNTSVLRVSRQNQLNSPYFQVYVNASGVADYGSVLSHYVNDAYQARIIIGGQNGSLAGGGIGFYAGASLSGMFDSSGNFGIGTTNPGAPLHTASGNHAMIVENSTARRAFFGVYNDEAMMGVNRNPTTGTVTASYKATANILVHGSADSGYIYFQATNTNGATPITRMTVLGNGNVGIGTTSPQAPLHVASGYAVINSSTYAGTGRIKLQLGSMADGVSGAEGTLSIGDTGEQVAIHIATPLSGVNSLTYQANEGGVLTARNFLQVGNNEGNYTRISNRGANSQIRLAANNSTGGGGGESDIVIVDGSTKSVTLSNFKIESNKLSYIGNSNLHLEASDGYYIYLNYYTGTAGTRFGNGANGVVGWVDGSGNASFNGTLNVVGNLSAGNISENVAVSTIAKRNSAGDIQGRLFRATYVDESNISGALAYRVNNSTDNYIRFCNNKVSIRNFIQTPYSVNPIAITGTGGTTDGLMTVLTNLGMFTRPSILKTTWSYASNDDITDTGLGTLELAGAVIETFPSAAQRHVRITCTNTGGSANTTWIYNDQGSGYSPGWRKYVEQDSSGNLAITNEFRSTGTNVTRFVQGNYGLIWRQDGTSLWALITASGDQYGTYNNLRPFRITLADGTVSLGNNKLVVKNAGNVGIAQTSPAYPLDVTGTIRATGDVIAYSDRRVKKNIKPIENALDKLMTLTGYTFHRIDADRDMAGVIAQEVEEVLPQAVYECAAGYKSVSPQQLQGLILQALKELALDVAELKARMA